MKRLVKVSLGRCSYPLRHNPRRGGLYFAHVCSLRSAMMKQDHLKLWLRWASLVALSEVMEAKPHAGKERWASSPHVPKRAVASRPKGLRVTREGKQGAQGPGDCTGLDLPASAALLQPNRTLGAAHHSCPEWMDNSKILSSGLESPLPSSFPSVSPQTTKSCNSPHAQATHLQPRTVYWTPKLQRQWMLPEAPRMGKRQALPQEGSQHWQKEVITLQ